jgi:hypothetical protein
VLCCASAGSSAFLRGIALDSCVALPLLPLPISPSSISLSLSGACLSAAAAVPRRCLSAGGIAEKRKEGGMYVASLENIPDRGLATRAWAAGGSEIY